MADINETMIKVVELDQSTPLKVSLVDVSGPANFN